MFSEHFGEAVDHHVEAGVHVLVHLGCQEDGNRAQLDQVGRAVPCLTQTFQITICDGAGQIERVLRVALNSVQLLYETNHRLSIFSFNAQLRVGVVLQIVSQGDLFAKH